ncbi:MAG: AAA family ATPase [Erysipelotrichaceae bacterium]|nr:AAA family ATPase [Erysipelotrichaceae bacterium]
MKTVKKIVLTGGPCSGKTTFTSRAQEFFQERGYRVIIDNESATDLISGGISPATLSMYDFQKYVVALQLKKEELCLRAAEEMEGEKVLLIIDRGLPDDMAYVGEEAFKEILSEFDLTIDEMYPRYDMVIHLVTSAKGKEEAYTYANNAARYESVEDARRMDDQALESWKDHPNRVVIGNETDFELKMRNAIQAIVKFLGEENTEIYNKYLIEVNDEVIKEMSRKQNFVHSHIIQHYLDSKVNTERRIRQRERNGSIMYTYSEARYLSTNERIKVDRVLSERQYFDYMGEVDDKLNVIDKQRYSFIENSHFYKLDVFNFDTSKGILSVQIPLNETDIELPDFVKIIKDVSDDQNYKNYYLAKSQKY